MDTGSGRLREEHDPSGAGAVLQTHLGVGNLGAPGLSLRGPWLEFKSSLNGKKNDIFLVTNLKLKFSISFCLNVSNKSWWN